jgi:glycine/D-amino acid oxidase-like deaminating enzyme
LLIPTHGFVAAAELTRALAAAAERRGATFVDGRITRITKGRRPVAAAGVELVDVQHITS